MIEKTEWWIWRWVAWWVYRRRQSIRAWVAYKLVEKRVSSIEAALLKAGSRPSFELNSARKDRDKAYAVWLDAIRKRP